MKNLVTSLDSKSGLLLSRPLPKLNYIKRAETQTKAHISVYDCAVNITCCWVTVIVIITAVPGKNFVGKFIKQLSPNNSLSPYYVGTGKKDIKDTRYI